MNRNLINITVCIVNHKTKLENIIPIISERVEKLEVLTTLSRDDFNQAKVIIPGVLQV